MNTKEFWPYFRWLFLQGLDIVHAPMVAGGCSLLLIGLLVSTLSQHGIWNHRWKSYYSLIFAQFLFYPTVIAIGSLYTVGFESRQPRPTVHPFAELTVDVLFFVSLALSLFWLYRMKGLRWFAFFWLSLQQLLLAGAVFVAGMSITGDWL